jgi:pimeloyl-ACP methyl ester carboxylesterase
LRFFLSWFGTLLRWSFFTLLMVAVWCYVFLLIFAWHVDQRETLAARDTAPATGRYVKAADIDIFLQEAGPPDGLDVLLIPGIGGWSGTWPQTMTLLAEAGFHVVAIDLPPFGYSQQPPAALYGKADQAARILGVMDALGITRAILVAHSTGGGPAVEAASLPQHRFSGLVLVDAELDIAFDRKGKAYPPFLVDRFLDTPSVRDGVVAAFISNPLFTRHFLKWLVHQPDAATEAWAELYRQPLKLKGTTAAVSAWLPQWIANLKPARSEEPETYRKLNMPVHLICGDFDSVAPLEQARLLARMTTNTQLNIVHGTGHLPQVEASPLFNDLLLKSLDGIKYDLENKASGAAAAAPAAHDDVKPEAKDRANEK